MSVKTKNVPYRPFYQISKIPTPVGSGLKGVRGLLITDTNRSMDSDSTSSFPSIHTQLSHHGLQESLSSSRTIIGINDKMTGDLVFDRWIEIDGWIEGSLQTNHPDEATVMIGRNGIVKGNIIHMKEISISGQVIGNINAETIHLNGSASVEGNVSCKYITMDAKVRLYGHLFVSSSPPFPFIDENGYIIDKNHTDDLSNQLNERTRVEDGETESNDLMDWIESITNNPSADGDDGDDDNENDDNNQLNDNVSISTTEETKVTIKAAIETEIIPKTSTIPEDNEVNDFIAASEDSIKYDEQDHSESITPTIGTLDDDPVDQEIEIIPTSLDITNIEDLLEENVDISDVLEKEDTRSSDLMESDVVSTLEYIIDQITSTSG